MEKLWSVNNELLGTAHKNRYGAIVDFRPATVQVEGKKILVVPAKGVRESRNFVSSLTKLSGLRLR